MKVLHVIPAIAPKYGGPSAVAAGLVRALRNLGADARIATTSADGRDDLRVPHAVEIDHGGVPTIFFQRTFSESLKYSGAFAQWLRKNAVSYDLVHIHAVFSHSSVAAARACADDHIPYVVRPLGSLYPWALAHHRLRKKMFMALVGHRLLRRASAIHYTCTDEQMFAESEFEVPRGFITSLGVDQEMFLRAPAEIPPSAPYILFAGRLHVRKRLDRLIRAFAAATVDNWRLVIAGEGASAEQQSLEDVARRHGVRDRVDFVGWKSGEEKRRLISGASIAALVAAQENFGVFAAEAMAAGVPVVVAEDVGVSADVATAGAGWVVGDNDLEHVLVGAMSSSLERRRRGEAARVWAEQHYRWVSVARAVMNEYESVLGVASHVQSPENSAPPRLIKDH